MLSHPVSWASWSTTALNDDKDSCNRIESRYFQTSAADIHFFGKILMTKCFKRIRDLFEYALYKFTIYLLTNKTNLHVIIFAKCESGKHWRRLRDWSFCSLFHRSFFYMMTHNGSDVIAPTAQAATPTVTFPSLRKAALPSPSPFLVVSCSCRCCCICRCSSSNSNA